MASGMKFLYYTQKRPARRTVSSSVSEHRFEEFKRRFRRSGSLGVPFFPEEEVVALREAEAIPEAEEDEAGKQVITVIVRTSKSAHNLSTLLQLLPKGAHLKHLESRDPRGEGQHQQLVSTAPQQQSQQRSRNLENEIEVLLEVELEEQGGGGGPKQRPTEVVEAIQRGGFPSVRELSHTVHPRGAVESLDPGTADALSGAPWFPKSIHDLDICSRRVIMYGGGGLDADHPGFKDVEYRKRRMMFAEIALNYKQGEPIPRVEYTQEELRTWGVIYRRLREMHRLYACQEFLDNFELLERHCGYSENNIPQLEDVSRFLKAKTGFRVRPVAGYLSARDFLAGLAFRVFNCTQYLRHHADPFYTPEPDTVHELMGHMALFADPDFAQFSQEIGLASLGASEEDLKQLATLYFFSIEFGLCSSTHPQNNNNNNSTVDPPNSGRKVSLMVANTTTTTTTATNDQKVPGTATGPTMNEGENGGEKRPCVAKDFLRASKYKVYGAGLLSSAGELQHAIEDAGVEIMRFDPDRVVQQECLITTFQTAYFYTRNFEEAQQKLRTFTNSMARPFVVRFNPYTECVEVLNNKRSLMLAVNQLRSDVNLLAASLHNIL